MMMMTISSCSGMNRSLLRRTAGAAASRRGASFRRGLVSSSAASSSTSRTLLAVGGGGGRGSVGRSHVSPSLLQHRSYGSAAAAASSLLPDRCLNNSSSSNEESSNAAALLLAVMAAATATASSSAVASCEDSSEKKKNKKSKMKSKKKKEEEEEEEKRKRSKADKDLNVARVGREDIGDLEEVYDVDQLPVYTAAEVNARDGDGGGPVWMTYGGVVYDVTDFIPNHPGGSEKIGQAAGSAIEPFWYLYRQHYASDLPMKLMEHMAIGRLSEEDQRAVDEVLALLEEDDPYAKEPTRHRNLVVHSDTPCNAEVPGRVLTNQYLTPNSLFYVRHHHPVPYLTRDQVRDYRLKVDLRQCGGGKIVEFSIDDLKKMPRTEITATLQCSGNRRSGFNAHQRTSGTPWGQGAVSTARFAGVRLVDLLKAAGMEDPFEAELKDGIEHVRFHALDGMGASIAIQKAANPYGDVIVCYEMNGERLPRDHGFPLRAIVPGYAAVRNVKWLERIEPSKEESEGPWQRGLNYKTLPPNVTDAKGVDLNQMPSMTEVSVFSGITEIENLSLGQSPRPGDRVRVKAKGWAWAGGGRNIVRVDVTCDDGAAWATADLKQGSDQKFGRAWAWVFWECEFPEAVVREDGSIRLASKAVDLAFNVQPENPDHMWNVRGLGNNSWYRETLHQ